MGLLRRVEEAGLDDSKHGGSAYEIKAGGDVEAIARRAADAGLSMDRVSEGLRLRAADAFGITLVFV